MPDRFRLLLNESVSPSAHGMELTCASMLPECRFISPSHIGNAGGQQDLGSAGSSHLAILVDWM